MLETEHEKPEDDNEEIIGRIEETEWNEMKTTIASLQEGMGKLVDRIMEAPETATKPVQEAVGEMQSQVSEAEQLILNQSPVQETEQKPIQSKRKPTTKKIVLFRK